MELTPLQHDTIRYIRWRRGRYGAVYPADLARHYGVALPVIMRRLERLIELRIITRETGRMKPILIRRQRCTVCGTWLEETPEYFNRSTARSSGVQNICRTCRSETAPREYGRYKARVAAWFRANRDKQRASSAKYKLNLKRRRIQEIARRIAA